MSSKLRLVTTLGLAAMLLAVPLARAATSNVVVSQIFAGGGNSGAPFANDYVELFNRGASPVDLSGWTIQYASAGGTAWQATLLSGTVAPGRHVLVQLASAGAVGAALPAPDATGTTNLAGSGGKVALVRDASALACGATAGSCSANQLVEDLVGYGSASDYEGSAASPLTNTTALLRAAGGCTDSNANAADFATSAPAPRNSTAAAAPCSSSPPDETVTAAAAVDVDVQAVLSIALERSTISFGQAFPGNTPAPIAERVTVISNNAAGYALSVHRSAFAPADLPLAIAPAPSGQLLPIPIVPAADLLLATTTAPSSPTGDVWPTSLGFASPLPAVGPAHYTATVTFTVIGQ